MASRAVSLVLCGIALAAGSSSGAGGEAAATRQAQATTAPANQPTPFDACSLLTREDAAAALGEPAQGPRSAPAAGPQSRLFPGVTVTGGDCQYSGRGPHAVTVSAWRGSTGSAGRMRQSIERVCQGKERIAGLGDLACWLDSGHTQLHAIKAATFVHVQLSRSGDATEALTNVAKKMLDRVR